jgi:hypothetical protein
MAGRDQGGGDHYSSDPFFKRHIDAHWNACVGPQGGEENYVDGYIEAAIELADAVIDRKLFGKRDTLVLPILYNARHSVELALKFATRRLVKAGLVKPIERQSHDIRAYWQKLDNARLGDKKLLQTIAALKPFAESLDRIDKDGQGLRYHVSQSDESSLPHHPLANLEVIRASLAELAPLIEVLKNRVLSFLDERATGTFTNRCSRRDLHVIAQLIPRRDNWQSALFDEQKLALKARFKMGSNAFSDALHAIQRNRETKALIGIESDLLHLTDDDVVWLAEQWRRLHPPRDDGSGVVEVVNFSDASFEATMEGLATRKAVIDEVAQRLSADQLADIQAIFYLGRNGEYAERYEANVEETKQWHLVENDPKKWIVHLMDKTNFLTCVQRAVEKLGRLALSEKMKSL